MYLIKQNYVLITLVGGGEMAEGNVWISVCGIEGYKRANFL